jgi:hypothetical protein
MKTPVEILTDLCACSDALDFIRDNNHTLESAWLACERGDWLLWFAVECGRVERTKTVFIACQCARLALKRTKDPRVRACIERTEAWTRGAATLKQVRSASLAAIAFAHEVHDAAYAASTPHATYAAIAAEHAAYAAAYAASTPHGSVLSLSVASVPYPAVRISPAAIVAARAKTLKECADLVRKYLPQLP